jgi:hypothetical protein
MAQPMPLIQALGFSIYVTGFVAQYTSFSAADIRL